MISCSKKKIAQDNSLLGLDYYPNTIGKYVIYDVDSLVYTDLPKDTLVFKYRIKEKLAETYTDNSGMQAIRLERFIKKYDASRSYDSIPWTIKEVWMVNADEKSIQVVESNVRFTKLIFPVQEKSNWNGNARNTLGDEFYSYDYVDKTETLNGITLEKVLLVKQKDYRTLISYDSKTEKYAKGIGLIYREIKKLLSNTIVANKPVEDRIESGIIYKQTLVTHGQEQN
jgi:hypothetical protein